MSVNIFFSFTNICYLIVVRPFKETKILIVNLSGELCFLSILATVFLIILEISVSSYVIEMTIIVILQSFLAFQIIMVISSAIVKIRSLIRRKRKSHETRISYIVK